MSFATIVDGRLVAIWQVVGCVAVAGGCVAVAGTVVVQVIVLVGGTFVIGRVNVLGPHVVKSFKSKIAFPVVGLLVHAVVQSADPFFQWTAESQGATEQGKVSISTVSGFMENERGR